MSKCISACTSILLKVESKKPKSNRHVRASFFLNTVHTNIDEIFHLAGATLGSRFKHLIKQLCSLWRSWKERSQPGQKGGRRKFFTLTFLLHFEIKPNWGHVHKSLWRGPEVSFPLPWLGLRSTPEVITAAPSWCQATCVFSSPCFHIPWGIWKQLCSIADIWSSNITASKTAFPIPSLIVSHITSAIGLLTPFCIWLEIKHHWMNMNDPKKTSNSQCKCLIVVVFFSFLFFLFLFCSLFPYQADSKWWRPFNMKTVR